MSIEMTFIVAIITILSLILLIVTLIGYHEYKSSKLLVISFIFLFLLIRGIILSLGLFYNQINTITSSPYIWVFDLLILVVLYLAYSIKR